MHFNIFTEATNSNERLEFFIFFFSIKLFPGVNFIDCFITISSAARKKVPIRLLAKKGTIRLRAKKGTNSASS